MLRKFWGMLFVKKPSMNIAFLEWLSKKEERLNSDQRVLNEKISEASKVLEEYKAKLAEPNHNFTVLEAFTPDNEYFLSNLHEIANNKVFLFHMHVLKTDCLNAIVDGDEKSAIVRQGMLKGIDKVMRSLNAASAQYKATLGTQENEQV